MPFSAARLPPRRYPRQPVLPGMAALGAVFLLLAACGRTAADASRGPGLRVAAHQEADDVVAAQAGTILLVNDAATANPALMESPLQIPPGFDRRARTVRLAPGFSISLLAAGLSA